MARFGAADVERLLADAAIVRHRGKIEAAIANARALGAARRGRDADRLAHGHAPAHGPPRAAARRAPRADARVAGARAGPAERGFRFFGPTTAYAFMQAVGVVDDHVAGCFRAGS